MRLIHGDPVYLSIGESIYQQRSELILNTANGRKRPHDDDNSLHGPDSMDKRLTRRSLLSLTEMFRLRCRSCTLCLKADCGKCESCQVNQNSTSRDRQVCLQKQCKRISKENKIRPAVHGWYYIVLNKKVEKSSSSISRLPIIYQKLRLMRLSSKGDMSLTINIVDAIRACKCIKESLELGAFLENTFGFPLHENRTHVLIGKGFRQECYAVDSSIKVICGKIVHCYQHLIRRELLFAVQLQASVVIESERMAWGGYDRYCFWKPDDALIHETIMAKAPFYVQWMVPSSKEILEPNGQRVYPVFILEYKGSKLQFEVKSSMIPSAGNGLFVSCIGGKDFVLKPGEMVDLGVYAPLQENDVKSKHISLVKNLLFDWQVETWAFAACKHRPDAFIYDPTEDFTGIPNSSTKMNLICFINEIDGKTETACVSAQYDAMGYIHYLFGHWEKSEGCLTIPSNGEFVELLVRLQD